MNKLRKKLLFKKIIYISYNALLITISYFLNRFFQMLIFILFYNTIQNVFSYRFHADTIFPDEPTKAIKYCKIITVVVEVVYLLFCKELNVSVYSNLLIIFTTATLNALLQALCEKVIINYTSLKNYSSLTKLLDAYNISEINKHRMIEHFINNKTIAQIAQEEYVEEITIKQSIRRTKRKLGL